ncbi:MAG TPA: aldose epimerase, partial [Actinophytocola sp.]|nr:aldose epimerase [Actinophytocola sp.]
MTRPTGEQLEITQSGARAIVGTIGAGLRAYEV